MREAGQKSGGDATAGLCTSLWMSAITCISVPEPRRTSSSSGRGKRPTTSATRTSAMQCDHCCHWGSPDRALSSVSSPNTCVRDAAGAVVRCEWVARQCDRLSASHGLLRASRCHQHTYAAVSLHRQHRRRKMTSCIAALGAHRPPVIEAASAARHCNIAAAT